MAIMAVSDIAEASMNAIPRNVLGVVLKTFNAGGKANFMGRRTSIRKFVDPTYAAIDTTTLSWVAVTDPQ
jgi:hypothetical protein